MRTIFRRRSPGSLLTGLSALLFSANVSAAVAPGEKLVVAHCMACCGIGVALPAPADESRAKECPGWKRPVGGLLPEMAKYTHDPLGAAREEIRLAQYAGLDAFGLFNNANILGPHKHFAPATEAYWQAAQENGVFKIFPEIWQLPNEAVLAATVAEMAYLKEKYDSAWLRIDGKRVVFIAEQRSLLPADADIEATVDRILAPLGGRAQVYLAISVNPRPADYDYEYNFRPAPPPEAWLGLTNAVIHWWCNDYGLDALTDRAMVKFADHYGKEEWLRIMPSCFALREAWGPYLNERLGFAGFYSNWKRTLDRREARLAYVTTWNDNTEDTGIMPDVNHHYAFLELNRYFAAWYKNGAPPPVEKEQVLLFHHPQLTETPMVFPADAQPSFRHNSQATPPTDYLGVVVMLKEPAEVRINLRSFPYNAPHFKTIATRTFPAGVYFWLLYHPLKTATDSAVKNRDDVNVPEPVFAAPVYPGETDDFFLTELAEALKARDVYVGVTRAGKLIEYFRSHRSITDRADRADLTTIGNVFVLGE